MSAFREGLLKAVNEYGNGKFDGDDVRECMVGAVSIRLKDPVFESQTKNKLGNTEIRTELVNNVREELLHFFQRNKQIAETIIAKVQDTQQLRKELQDVKKLARERAKAITLRIPQLKDCKHHFDKKKDKGGGTMVFICEGPVRRRLHHQLPRREQSGGVRAEGQAAQCLGPQARRDV